jgi:hypothetical protein
MLNFDPERKATTILPSGRVHHFPLGELVDLECPPSIDVPTGPQEEYRAGLLAWCQRVSPAVVRVLVRENGDQPDRRAHAVIPDISRIVFVPGESLV